MCFLIFFLFCFFPEHYYHYFPILQCLILVPFYLFNKLFSLKKTYHNFITFMQFCTLWPSGHNDTNCNNNCYLFVYNIITAINLELKFLHVEFWFGSWICEICCGKQLPAISMSLITLSEMQDLILAFREATDPNVWGGITGSLMCQPKYFDIHCVLMKSRTRTWS